MRKAIIIPTLVVLAFTGCKKHEQPELTDINVDCDCATEVSADFEILELEALPQFNPVGTDSDTIFQNSNVIFRAKEDGAEYTWYIGANIYNTKEVGLNFPSAFAGQDITVSLVVRKATNAICFPNDDGVDSVARTFYVQTYSVGDLTSNYVNDTTLMEGVYRMKSPHLVDSFDVTIDYVDRINQPNEQIDILNYDGLGSNAISLPRNGSTLKTYRGLWLNNTALNYNCMNGTFFYKLDGEVIFEFNSCVWDGINVNTIEHHSYKMTGRKL